jgi:hypothetical protein
MPFEDVNLPIEENGEAIQDILEKEIKLNEVPRVQDEVNSNKLISSNIDESNILKYSRRMAMITGTPKTHNQAVKGDETMEWI